MRLIGNLYGTLPLFVGGALNALVTAIIVTLRHPEPIVVVWLAVELVIFAARLVTLTVARRSARLGRKTPTDLYVLLSLVWAAGVGWGTLLCLVSGDSALETMACMSAAAMAGGVCFRNFAAPRLAGCMILLSVGPCCFAGFLTGKDVLFISLVQMPFYLISMTAASYRLNEMLMATMRAEQENGFHARHDALTGLANRFGLEGAVALRRTLPDAGRGQAAILYLDLDGFKAVNDTHGHAVGDRLLQRVSARLPGLTVKGDLAARIGGDEFVILTDTASHPDLCEFADRIVTEISKPYDEADHGRIVVGVSIGIAVASSPEDDLANLMKAADSALYRAKSTGRGRSSFAQRQSTDSAANSISFQAAGSAA